QTLMLSVSRNSIGGACWVQKEDAMTEPEWLQCTDSMPMLEFLQGKVSGCRLFLFGIAASRSVWERLTDACKAHVELTERYVEGKANVEERSRIERAPRIGTNEVYLLVYLTPDGFLFACHCSGIGRVFSGWSAVERDDPVQFQRHAAREAML